MKYFLITFGCQMNKSDSERIAAVLESMEYQPAQKIDRADLIVVNMCSVRQSAVDRVYGLQPKFEKLKTKNDKLKTVLTGCILKKDRKKFAKYFNDVLSIKNLPKWPKFLSQKTHDRSFYETSNYLDIEPEYSSFPIAFVPISNGCNNFCAYCVVPYARGKEVTRPADEILCEVKKLVNQGYKEIWLLGQNVNSYRSGLTRIATQSNAEVNFSKLLRMVNSISGDFWVRFTSPHPKDFSNELIETMAQCQKVTPYLNLPVQSGNNEILRKMQRSYTIEDYRKLVKKIRKKIPNIALSTDVIVGFPGETKKQFENTVKLFREIKFDMAYIAQYSPRPETTAAKMKDNVLKKEKKEREKILTEILKKNAFEKNKKFIEKTIEVLPTENRNGFLLGKSFHYKTVKFKGSKDLIGRFQKVKVKDSFPFGLEGKLI